MDSWLGSLVSCHHWKWIYNLPRLQQTKSPHQNQRVYCLACSSGFMCWLGAIPSLFACDVTNTCYWPQQWLSWVKFIRLLFSSTSAVDLCGLDRFVAIVHPIKYITFMTRRRIIRIIFFSWVLTVSYNIIQFLILIICKTAVLIFFWLHLTFFAFPSMCCINILLCINDISRTQA